MANSAHPRVCGENGSSSTPSTPRAGSSPRVRGKRERIADPGDQARLIPACAGKTATARSPAFPSGAHPRVCGENTSREYATACQLGSSPRVRGKPDDAGALPRAPGLIPACAGKTQGRPTPGRSRPAHPRVCGENLSGVGGRVHASGSSPRVRGKLWTHVLAPCSVRLIPACAGKTPSAPPTYPESPAHPRVCGENGISGLVDSVLGGSSPRVRGKLFRGGCHVEDKRLIPACAGKTPATSGPPSKPPAHPRVCGENEAFEGLAAQGLGSSPRVRGKPHGPVLSGQERGLIPACAGKTGRL